MTIDFFTASVVSSSEIDLAWGGSYDSAYILYAGDVYSFDGSVHSFAVTGLDASTSYQFTVAVDGEYAETAVHTSATTLAIDTPSDLSAFTDPDNGVTLSFTAINNADSYSIFRSTDGNFSSTPFTTVSADSLSYLDDGSGALTAQYSDSTGLDGVNYSYKIVAKTPDGLSSLPSPVASVPAFHVPTVVTNSGSDTTTTPYTFTVDGGSVSGTTSATSNWSYSLQYTDTSAVLSEHLSIESSYVGSGTYITPVENGSINGTINQNGLDHYMVNLTLIASRPNTSSDWVVQSGNGTGTDQPSDNLTYDGKGFATDASGNSPVTIALTSGGDDHTSAQSSFLITLGSDSKWCLSSGSGTATDSANDGMSYSGTISDSQLTAGGAFGSATQIDGGMGYSVRASFTSSVADGAWRTTGLATNTFSGSSYAVVDGGGTFSTAGVHNSTLAGTITSHDILSSNSGAAVVSQLGTDGNWTMLNGSGTTSKSEAGNTSYVASGSFSYNAITGGPAEAGNTVTGTEIQTESVNWLNTFNTASSFGQDGKATTTGSSSTHNWGFSDDLINGSGPYTRAPAASIAAAGSVLEYSHTHSPFDFSTQSILNPDGTTTTTGSGTSSSPNDSTYTFNGGGDSSQSGDDGSGVSSSLTESNGTGPDNTSNVSTTWAWNPNTNQLYPAVTTSTDSADFPGGYSFNYDEKHLAGYSDVIENKQVESEHWDTGYTRTLVATTDVNGNVTISGLAYGHTTSGGSRTMDLTGWGGYAADPDIHMTEGYSYSNTWSRDYGTGFSPFTTGGGQTGTQTNVGGPSTGTYSYSINASPRFATDDVFDIPFQMRKAVGTPSPSPQTGYNNAPYNPHMENYTPPSWEHPTCLALGIGGSILISAGLAGGAFAGEEAAAEGSPRPAKAAAASPPVPTFFLATAPPKKPSKTFTSASASPPTLASPIVPMARPLPPIPIPPKSIGVLGNW